MWQMIRTEGEILTSVGGLSADSGGQCHLLPDDQNIQEWNQTDSTYMVN
jgi:hypothetical protein